MFTNTSAQKWQIGLSLALVFILIFGTNRLDKKHFESVQYAVTALYEDRVVAQHYLQEITLEVISWKANLPDSNYTIHFDQTNELILAFENTKLSTKEFEEFKRLKDSYNKLKAEVKANQTISNKRLNTILASLSALRDIQLTEGKRELIRATESLERNSIMTYLEWVLLFLIAIGAQFLIFYSPKKPINEEEG